MQVLVVDPYVDRASGLALGYRFADSLAQALPQAQFVTLHCPRNAETLGMLGAAELALLPAGAAVVNCARGGIVDEQARCTACLNCLYALRLEYQSEWSP